MTAAVHIRRHASARAFRERAEAWLLAREAEHNLLLGLAARLEHATAGFEHPIYLATVERGAEVVGCAFRTPPFKLGITRLPAEALAPLADDVAGMYDALPGLLGPEPEAAGLARLWSEPRGVVAREGMRQRIYQLERVLPPERPAPGHARLATDEDLDTVVAWVAAFTGEALGSSLRLRPVDQRSVLRGYIAGEKVMLWDDGGSRALAAAPAETPHGARIGYVYTPPEWRRRGYASACVAALSQRVLEGGRRFCFLYTDLANPTSNAIYQRIGYQPVCDVVDYHFDAPAPGAEDR